MSASAQSFNGSVVALWRYPVKSMMGEELNAAEVSKAGLLGDRAYALVDGSDGKVASAKLDFGRFRRRGRGHFPCVARYGAEFRYYLGAAGT